MTRGWTRLRMALAIGAASGVLMVLRMFFPKPIGMADNGDGVGLMCHLNVAPRQQGYSALYDAHAIFRYYSAPTSCGQGSRGASSTILFMRANEWLARQLHFGAPVDLRISIALYCVFVAALVVGVCLAVPWGWKGQVASAAGFLLIAGDSSIAGYPGSQFTETAGIVGLLIMGVAVLWAARTDRGVTPAVVGLVVFAGATVLAMTAKPEMVPSAVPIVLFLVWLVCRDRPQWFTRDMIKRATSGVVEVVGVLALAAIVTVTAAGIISIRGNPTQFASIYKTETLFSGILPHTHAAQALKEMGLPPSMAKYKGDNWWESNYAIRPENDPAFPWVANKESYTLYAKFMARHPQVGIADLDVGAQNFLRGQVFDLGSYQAGEGPQGVQEKRIALLSTLMSDLSPTGLFGYMAVSGGVAWLAIRFARRRRRGSLGHSAAVGSLLFNAIAATQLATGTFADNPAVVKHYIFGVVAAFLAGGLVALAAACIGDRRPTKAASAAAITQEFVVPPEEHPVELVGAGSS